MDYRNEILEVAMDEAVKDLCCVILPDLEPMVNESICNLCTDLMRLSEAMRNQDKEYSLKFLASINTTLGDFKEELNEKVWDWFAE